MDDNSVLCLPDVKIHLLGAKRLTEVRAKQNYHFFLPSFEELLQVPLLTEQARQAVETLCVTHDHLHHRPMRLFHLHLNNMNTDTHKFRNRLISQDFI